MPTFMSARSMMLKVSRPVTLISTCRLAPMAKECLQVAQRGRK
jgi:hypothetical protein